MDYEPKHYENKGNDQDCMTVVEFSTENPYGSVVAMIDFKHGILKVKDEQMASTSITLAFILLDILKAEGDFVAEVISSEDDISSQLISLGISKAAQLNNDDEGYVVETTSSIDSTEYFGPCTIVVGCTSGGCIVGGCNNMTANGTEYAGPCTIVVGCTSGGCIVGGCNNLTANGTEYAGPCTIVVGCTSGGCIVGGCNNLAASGGSCGDGSVCNIITEEGACSRCKV